MSKLYFDILSSISPEFDTRSDYKLPGHLNGKGIDEIREYVSNFIDRMPNAIVVFAEKPYGKGAAYFYNHEDAAKTNEVVYACSEDLKLNMAEICKYLTFDIKKRGLRLYVFIGENGVYSQLTTLKLKRFAKEGSVDTYENGKTLKNLVEEKYFADFTEEGYMPAFAELGKEAAE